MGSKLSITLDLIKIRRHYIVPQNVLTGCGSVPDSARLILPIEVFQTIQNWPTQTSHGETERQNRPRTLAKNVARITVVY